MKVNFKLHELALVSWQDPIESMNIELYMHRHRVDALFYSTSLVNCQGKQTLKGYAAPVQDSPCPESKYDNIL